MLRERLRSLGRRLKKRLYKSMDRDPSLKSPQEQLKSRLISGAISPDQFLDEIDKLDQSNLERTHAFKNAEILEDDEVKKFFESGESVDYYYLALSLAYFHTAQDMAIEESTEALKYFEMSLESFKRANIDRPEETIAYYSATIAYLKKDIDGVEKALHVVNNTGFKPIVERFLARLKSGAEINYKEDYFGIKTT